MKLIYGRQSKQAYWKFMAVLLTYLLKLVTIMLIRPVDEMDPICKEESNIEGWEDAKKEKVKSCHLHFVLRNKEELI